jgi:hypothetical protein
MPCVNSSTTKQQQDLQQRHHTILTAALLFFPFLNLQLLLTPAPHTRRALMQRLWVRPSPRVLCCVRLGSS